jgi:hemerythrin-like domain-containing protein
MEALVEEHKYGRSMVAKLVQAKQDYLQGQEDALPRIVEHLRALVAFYPQHIEKEDKDFFPNSERYLSEPEQQAMLQEFWEFDRQMIHEKYRAVVAALRAQLQP